MDAYYDYVKLLTDIRLSELRVEAEADRLARLKKAGQARRFRLGFRTGRRTGSPLVAEPVRLPRPMAEAEADQLRRSA